MAGSQEEAAGQAAAAGAPTWLELEPAGLDVAEWKLEDRCGLGCASSSTVDSLRRWAALGGRDPLNVVTAAGAVRCCCCCWSSGCLTARRARPAACIGAPAADGQVGEKAEFPGEIPLHRLLAYQRVRLSRAHVKRLRDAGRRSSSGDPQQLLAERHSSIRSRCYVLAGCQGTEGTAPECGAAAPINQQLVHFGLCCATSVNNTAGTGRICLPGSC